MTPPMAQIFCVPTIQRYRSLDTNFRQLLLRRKTYFFVNRISGRKTRERFKYAFYWLVCN
ncbi:MAG: hypothetical protein DMG96_22345 [Acidobacteria bacterium]|nr:MAG: hypothetical protein DMG96_22345 [Acidobacteriota bacterium]